MSTEFVWFDRDYLQSMFPYDPPVPPHRGGKPPKRKWMYNGKVYAANTRSEARGLIKKDFKLKSLSLKYNELREITV